MRDPVEIIAEQLRRGWRDEEAALDVIEALRLEGWRIVPAVSVSNLRIVKS